MDNDQIVDELRDLSDRIDRAEAGTDTIGAHLGQMRQREIPAAVADVTHRLDGTMQMLADLAGTVHTLSLEVRSQTDRLTLLEKAWE